MMAYAVESLIYLSTGLVVGGLIVVGTVRLLMRVRR